jgi:hypothetical protein
MRRIFKPTAGPWVRVAFIAAALAIWLSGLLCLLVVGSKMWRMERLRREGVVVVGKVTARQALAIARLTGYELAYSFPAKIPEPGARPSTAPASTPRSGLGFYPELARLEARVAAIRAGRDPDPNEIRVREVVPWKYYNSLQFGQETPVTFMPGRPDIHEIGRVDSARVWAVPFQDANFRVTLWGLLWTVSITLVFAYVLLGREPKGQGDWQ